MNLQQKLTAWQKMQDEDMTFGWHILIFMLKEGVSGLNYKANLDITGGPDGDWAISIKDFPIFPEKMRQQLQGNEEKIQEYFKNIDAQVDMSPPNPVVGRAALTKWLSKIGLENWVVGLMDHLTRAIASGKAQLNRKKDFSLQIPGPGFDEPIGSPKGRKKAKFMRSRRKKYFGDVEGDFRVYKDKLVAQGYYSFDDFYKAIKDCFGAEWQPKSFPDHGMDYKFRDEHERAFKMLKVQIDADKCGKPPVGTEEEEPEKPKEPEKDIPTVDTKESGLFTSPRHASVRIVPESDTLVYGEQDPLDIYGKEIPIVSVSLNKFIKEKFGYEGGWEEYKQKHRLEITRKTIIQRKDGSRVEFEKSGEWVFQEGDKIVQKATLWPFHVYFAFQERNKLIQDSPEDSTNILVQLKQENLNSLKKIPNLFKQWLIKKVSKNLVSTVKAAKNVQLDLNDIENFDVGDEPYEKEVKEYYSKIESGAEETTNEIFGVGWGEYISAQEVVGEESEIVQTLMQRFSVYGLAQYPPGAYFGFYKGKNKEGKLVDKSIGANGIIDTLLVNPPEKLQQEGKDLVKRISDQAAGNGKKRKGSTGSGYLPAVAPRDVFTPNGMQVFASTKRVEISPDSSPSAARVAQPGASLEKVKKLTVDLAGKGLIGQSFYDSVQTLVIKNEIIKNIPLGAIFQIPTDGLAFSRSETIFFKRIGLDEKSGVHFNPYKNKYNTSDGKRPNPYRDGSRVRIEPIKTSGGEASEQEVEVDQAQDPGGPQDYGGAMALALAPAELVDTKNSTIDELTQRRLAFCKNLTPEKRENVWICGLGPEQEEIWRNVLVLQKKSEAPEIPVEKKKKIKNKIRNKTNQIKAVVKKEKAEPITEDIWWGPLMQFEGTENVSLKRKKRGWAHKNAHKQLMSLSNAISNNKGNLAGTKWFVEDISREINGKKYVSMGGHKSHSIGLDYDISIPTLDEKGASIWTNKESESVPWGFMETKVDNINIPAVVDFFRHAYRSGVHAIFSDRKIINAVVNALKKYAEGAPVGPPDRANRFGDAYYKSTESFGKVTAEEINWFVNSIRHLGGHRKHFHVRVAQDTIPAGKAVYTGGKRGRYVLKSSRYYNPKAIARAKNLNESRASLKNYLSESLDDIIQEINEGKLK